MTKRQTSKKTPRDYFQAKPGEPGPDYDYPRTLAELKERLSINNRNNPDQNRKKLRDEQAEETMARRTG